MALRQVSTTDLIAERLSELAAELIEQGVSPDVVGQSMIGAGAAMLVQTDGNGAGATQALLNIVLHIARKDRPAVPTLARLAVRGTA